MAWVFSGNSSSSPLHSSYSGGFKYFWVMRKECAVIVKRRGKSERVFWEVLIEKKHTYITGNTEFPQNKKPHWTTAFEILSLCSSPALRGSNEKKRGARRREGRHNVRTGWKTASAYSGTPHQIGPLYICHTISGQREGFILKVACSFTPNVY